ncbi:hypothetical protein Tco_0434429 [Tanacetum coccineum]
MQKAQAKAALLKAQPTFLNVQQLTKLLLDKWGKGDFKQYMEKLEIKVTSDLKVLPRKLEEFQFSISVLTSQVDALENIKLDILVRLLALPVNVSSINAQLTKLKVLDDIPSLLNKVAEALDRTQVKPPSLSYLKENNKKDAANTNLNKQPIIPEKITITKTIIIPSTLSFQSHFISSPPKTTLQTKGEKVRDKGKKAISHEEVTKEESDSDSDEIKNQKRIKQTVKADVSRSKIKKGKKDLIDTVGLEVVEKIYKDKIKYDKYCLKMLNKRAHEIIQNFKDSDLHLGEWKEVMDAYPERTRAGWTTIFTQMRPRLDVIHQPKAEKKRKNPDDLHDYFKSTKRYKKSVQFGNSQARTVLNEPTLGMILFNFKQRQDFISIEDFEELDNDMLYNVQEFFSDFTKGLEWMILLGPSVPSWLLKLTRGI